MDRVQFARAWSAVNFALAMLSVALLVVTLDIPWTGWGFRGATLPPMVVTVWLTWLVATRRPDNAVGWALLVATTHLLLNDIGAYARLWLADRGGELPVVWAVLFDSAWVPGMVALLYAMARFPDGEAPSGWRGRAIHVLGPMGIVTVTVAMALDEVGLSAPGVLFLPMPPYAVLTLSTVASRFRASSGIARQQFRWIAYGSIPFFLSFLMLPVAANNEATLPVQAFLSTAGMTLMIGAMGVAVLRYRLWELDRILSRTVSWTLLTGVLAVIWTALAIAPTLALGGQERPSDAMVAAATLLAAAAFNPLRVRIQSVIDRRMNRDRYDARVAIDRLGLHLSEEVDLDAMSSRVVATLAETVQPRHVAVWVPDRHTPVTPEP